MARYLPERCMQDFGYVQTISKSPSQVAPDIIVRWDLDDIFEDWEQYIVSQDNRLTQVSNSWHCIEGYVTWFYTLSHPILTPDALGRPYRITYEEILENQQAQDDHATDVLPICQRIQVIGKEALD
ncbi:uncharacterized protein LOC131619381 [Vicia villosa]|uniref:uncharacterized protein LOC131619381 n=1 Tax=Vicia villosa TaxID=3911 RepID=UPI00273C8937|nr:uncharacterized protein LOC131619381 [Vicia villosa]